MKFKALVLFFILLTGAPVGSIFGFPDSAAFNARQGKIDFGGQLQVDQKPVLLNGEWEFYWKQLLVPEDFKLSDRIHFSGYIRLPRFWNNYQIEGNPIEGKGYATFRLVIDNILPYRLIFIQIPYINSSFRLYANGVFIGQCGVVATSENASRAGTCPLSSGFYLDQERLELIIQVSNFRHFKGGISKEILLADYKTVSDNSNRQLAIDLFLIGALLIMGLYYIGVFSLRKRDKFTLYFGLFSLFIALRTSFHNATFFFQIFPDFDWGLYTRLDYLTLTVSPVLFLAFIIYLYPDEFSSRIFKAFFSISLFFSLLIGFSSIYFFTGLLTAMQVIIVLAAVYSTYVIIRAITNRRKGAKEMLVGNLVLIICVINDILFAQNLLNTTYISGYGLLLFIFALSHVITKRFTNALENSEELSQSLEMKVKDQTSEIRDLLDNTGQGILSFDRNLVIQEQTSLSTHNIFEKQISGENVVDLMFPDNKEEMAGYMEILFKSGGKMNLVRDLLPSEYIRNDKFYHMSFRWIPAGKSTSDRVMVILTDMTIKRKLEKMLEKDEQRNQKIIRIAVDRHGFLRFYNSVQEVLQKIRKELSGALQDINPRDIARNFHTIKGGLSGYAFVEVADVAHTGENQLTNVLNGKESINPSHKQSLIELTDRIENKFRESILELGDLIPKQLLKVSNVGFYRISEEKIDRLEQYLLHHEFNSPDLKALVKDLRKQPLRNLMKKIASDAKDIAYQLGKQVEVNYSGEDNQIFHSPLEGFFANLIHLVRNALDHGIEYPSERLKKGKPETGKITIEIALNIDTLELTFSDDGNGIDPQIIKSKAIENGILNTEKGELLDKEEIYRLIFEPGFSTRKLTTKLSGRGIGLNAIATSIKNLGGTYSVESEIDKGTSFRFAIPVIH